MAELTKSRGDPWLSDLLEGENLPGFGSAARTLGQARRSNMTAEYGRARDLAQQAKTWFQANSNQAGALRALFEISFSEQVDRHVGDCRRHADEGLRLAEASAYGWLVIQLALEEGICRGLGGEISGAKRLETLAVARSQELGYSTLHLRALNLVANDQADDGDHAQAWRTSLHGMEMYWSGQTAVMPGFNFYVNLAYAAEDRGRPHLALALQRETVRLIDSDPDLLLRASSHSALARTAAKVNELQTAETQYLEAERLFSLAPQTDAVRESRREEETRYAQFDVQRGQADAALARLTRIEPEMRNLTNDYLAQLFYSTLGEVQLRRNQPRQAEIALQPALAISERNLKYMRTESERTAWSKLAAPIYLGLVEAELAQGGVEDSLATFEWYLGASQRAGRASPRREKPSGASWLHPRLAKLADKTILTYAALPGGLAIWVYDDRGLYFHWLPDRNATAWEDLVARLDDACSDPKSNLAALQRDSRSLYGLLIAPIEEHIDFHRTLVIEADGWARRVPFEVLLDTQGRYLLSRATIVYSLGRSSDDTLRPAAPIAPQSKALIVGSTGVFPGQLPPVGVQEQATDVTHHFEHTRLLLDRDVVLAKVTDDLRSAEVFHFAGHSQILSDRAAFVLEERDPATGKPRLLDANSLRDSKMPSLQLAVLAACSTADAHDTEDDEQGFHSMAGAFLRASVPRVVASRWPVDAVETRRFMDTFYRDLLSGIPVSQAVRATSLSVLANPHSAHPYYWSAFSVYGRE